MSDAKFYTNRSNCVRAAKKALGKTATVGQDFTLQQNGEGLWGYAETVKQALAPKAKKAKEPKKPRVKGKLWEQPAMRDVIKLMNRAAGCTVEDIANKRACNKDTARGMVSRLRSEVKGITMGRVFKKVTYFVTDENLPEGFKNEDAAE